MFSCRCVLYVTHGSKISACLLQASIGGGGGGVCRFGVVCGQSMEHV